MQYLHVFGGQWNFAQRTKLKLKGITIGEHGFFHIIDSQRAEKLVKEFKSADRFYYKKANAIFSLDELCTKTFMLKNSSPDIGWSARLSPQDDEYDYLRFAFGEICATCNMIPKGEQLQPLTLKKEPKLAKKYIWGGFHGVSGYLFTDKRRAKLLEAKWGLKSKKLLIGARQKTSVDFVQIDIPIANSELAFGNSNFGNTFKTNRSGEISSSKEICEECNKPLYSNQTLDFFPSFEKEEEFDIVFTKEWFGWYRRVVISNEFATWLREIKFIKHTTDHLTPVKNFNSGK